MPEQVVFHFDALCPWTWLTSRWLVDVAEAKQLSIEWRPLSLAILNEGGDVPEKHRAMHAVGMAFHRIMVAADKAGDNARIGVFYKNVGERLFTNGVEPSLELIVAAAEQAGFAEAVVAASSDAGLDSEVRTEHDQAMALAGPDVGSPIVQLSGSAHGLSGPVIDVVPSHDDGLRLWDLTAALLRMPAFYELKRGRKDEPQLLTR